ncbi:hypothetical protein EJV47_02620 [Hymenobacter gummosus]|uniref:MotA/TolQ/ExbB proton channel domain-containing protein n=1 Tax=Hymenobacter gummosus TaxID=1776032 RepID=A0A431U9E3_9BACT|nr:hypothetical protein [Hymenobacter gummosus]RTQ53648.1 hypothetical protein EJV47_02620 [Hymenobacter gummosus]
MAVQYIEIFLILALIGWQAFIFFKNYGLIQRVRAMYPDKQQLGLVGRIAAEDSIGRYDAVTVEKPTREFDKVVAATNDYLRANKGAAADFNALRDISEREAELLDAEIEAQISTPLYLGLLGTFLGAIFGLFSLLFAPAAPDTQLLADVQKTLTGNLRVSVPATIPVTAAPAEFNAFVTSSPANEQAVYTALADRKSRFAASPEEFHQKLYAGSSSFGNDGIQRFLIGVLIAMIGSLFGLGFTLAGNQLLKSARTTRDRLKNDYYNFLQRALLPKLNSDMQQGLNQLRAVLDAFNQDFFAKIQGDFFAKIAEFTPLIGRITENISIQKDFLEKLQTIGYTQLANATIKVFDRVDQSAATFEKFLGYQQALNVAVEKGAQTAYSVSALLDRLSSLEKALNQVPGYLEQHNSSIRQQADFFNEHHQLLQQIGKETRQALDKVNQGVDQALNEEAALMRQVLEKRRDEFVAQAQAAHAEWDAHFRQLNSNNIYEKITEYLNPFQQLPAQQKELNRLQEEQARRSTQALQALQEPLEQNRRIQEQLLLQTERTNAILARLTEPNWFQRTILGKKTPPLPPTK